MLPLDFFAPLDRQLLSAFCEASALRQQAAAIIAAEGVVIGTGASRIVHPAMRHVATSASMASLAGKLHLSHSSRLARDVADTQAKRPWDRPGK
ncbi:Phage terminase, small subunit [Caballeronia choica]|jgi:phage terminase small subunit|uniref:Phage terminase, small subunit n=1 Tax=Caballeronia choica TaxID=326476 RepID=A0A158KPV3_9BURK|nr:P27 family phage terminase small subunit [Caballeronia choica]SAL82620.1 Phage terminase, small subunit [Caballeronia choica]